MPSREPTVEKRVPRERQNCNGGGATATDNANYRDEPLPRPHEARRRQRGCRYVRLEVDRAAKVSFSADFDR
jgi:hypothetical protein